MIAHFFYIPIVEVEDLDIKEYNKLFEQAINLGALYRQGEFQLQDSESIQEEATEEAKYFTEIGQL